MVASDVRHWYSAANQADVILAFISSVLPASPTEQDVIMDPSTSDFADSGLKVPSVIRLSKIATIERRLVTRRIGRLGDNRLMQVDEALIAALGIDTDRYATAERQRLADILATDGPEALIAAVRDES